MRDPTNDEIDGLIEANPLGLVMTMRLGEARSTRLPLLLSRDEDPLGVIEGHFDAADDQVAILRSDPRALIAFNGPGGYLPSSSLRSRDRAPAWFHASVEFLVEIEFLDRRSDALASLVRLVGTFEERVGNRLGAPELERICEPLLEGVRPFKAWVLRVRPDFRLGEDMQPGEIETRSTPLAAMAGASSR
ncbi:MAG TPA: FMN-binding negative transcriptional regulator [Sphingomicrobium sp.]|nr:FMN-binding negative transcriptional regulator [Sphingomicrobium sp.]